MYISLTNMTSSIIKIKKIYRFWLLNILEYLALNYHLFFFASLAYHNFGNKKIDTIQNEGKLLVLSFTALFFSRV